MLSISRYKTEGNVHVRFIVITSFEFYFDVSRDKVRPKFYRLFNAAIRGGFSAFTFEMNLMGC